MDYLYNKNGSYNKRTVKKILEASKAKAEVVPSDEEGFMKWLNGDKQPLRDEEQTEMILIIMILIIWAACFAFAVWRWIDDFGEIELLTTALLLVMAPFCALVALFLSPLFRRFNINPVIWRRK